jgi:hypothetical protein
MGDEELRRAGEDIVEHAMQVVKDEAIARERAEQLLILALDRLEVTDPTASKSSPGVSSGGRHHPDAVHVHSRDVGN